MRTLLIGISALAALSAGPVLAQQDHSAHQPGAAATPPVAAAAHAPARQPNSGPAPQGMGQGPAQGMMQGGMTQGGMMDAYMRAMQPSMQAMMRASDRDADRAFALKMMEHHRGGIAMMDVLATTGDDAELKRMATMMKQEQQKEIGALQAWLDRHGGRTPAP